MTKPRARDLGIPFEGTTGKYNAITDVQGVTVGYSTVIEGSTRVDRKTMTLFLPPGSRSTATAK